MGGCQNYGPLLGPLITRCRTIIRTEKGTIVLTTLIWLLFGVILVGGLAIRALLFRADVRAGFLGSRISQDHGLIFWGSPI